MKMSINKRITHSFTKNPVAWILAGLLAFSLYSHGITGRQFTEVCERIAALEEGYFDPESSNQFHTSGIDENAIMVKVQEHEYLMTANTHEGRAYRWWRKQSQYLRKVCSARLAEPDPRDDL